MTPVINLNRCAPIPASSKTVRAAAACSRSVSMDVRTASEGAPLNIHNPLTPEPVPISAIDFALRV